VSQPPEYPGRQRMKRVAAAAGSDAYQGAFEAIGSVLIACAFGYWVDSRWDTAPWGLLIGTGVGFAAMVLRLVRLGKEIHPDPSETATTVTNEARKTSDPDVPGADDLGVGESPGLSSVLRDEGEDRIDDDESGKAE